MKIYKSVSELVGNTPLLRLSRMEKKENVPAVLLAKLELFNPAGSVKDRIAKAMIEDAEKSGLLKKRICYNRTYKRQYRYRAGLSCRCKGI